MYIFGLFEKLLKCYRNLWERFLEKFRIFWEYAFVGSSRGSPPKLAKLLKTLSKNQLKPGNLWKPS